MATFSAVSIVTRDMSASIDFYQALGLRLESGGTLDPHVSFAGDGVQLMLDTEALTQQLDPGWNRPQAPGGHAMAPAFSCGTPAEVDEVFTRLTTAGAPAKAEPWDAFWGQRYASVLDPDGNQVDLFCEL